jgi:hypothetical protein
MNHESLDRLFKDIALLHEKKKILTCECCQAEMVVYWESKKAFCDLCIEEYREWAAELMNNE